MIGIDMEMPKSCAGCPLTYEDEQMSDRCAKTGEYVGEMIDRRHENCPLRALKEECATDNEARTLAKISWQQDFCKAPYKNGE